METTGTTERSKINNPAARVLAAVNAPIKVAFDYIQPVPLDIIFPGYHNIPAIVQTDEKEPWITAGKSRTVTFAEGNSALESMLHADGSWLFIALEDEKVLIDWKYVFTPKNEEAKGIIEQYLLPGFQGMLEQAVKISKENLGSGK